MTCNAWIGTVMWWKKSIVLFANGFLRPTQLEDHMEEGSQWKRGEDNFITLHVGKMAGLLFSRPTRPWVRRPPAASNTAASQVMFFPPLLQTPEAAVSVASLFPGAAGPALLLYRPLTA